MSRSLPEGAALALDRVAFTNARGAPAHVDVAAQEKRTALVAPLAIPSTRGLVGKVGTHNLAAVAPAAAARSYLSSIPRQLRPYSINGARISRIWNAMAAPGGEAFS